MTERTNPLIDGKANASRKITVDDLYSAAVEANATAEKYGAPWHFQVVPNEDGRMCLRRFDLNTHHRGPPCTQEQAEQIMREYGLRSNPLG